VVEQWHNTSHLFDRRKKTCMRFDNEYGGEDSQTDTKVADSEMATTRTPCARPVFPTDREQNR